MALHGQIKVNGHPVGRWAAVRKEEVSPGRYRYATAVEHHFVETSGSVEHDYADGALVLAGKVLLAHAMAEKVANHG